MAGRGRRKTTEKDPNQELPGMPPSDRIWADYHTIPIERVNVAFGGFTLNNRSLANVLQTVAGEPTIAMKVRVQGHKYITKHDADFGDDRGRVVVTLIPLAITVDGSEPVIIEGTITEPETEEGDA